MSKGTISIETVNNLLKQGLNGQKIAETMGIKYAQLSSQLELQNTSIKALKAKAKSPANRAWETIRKKEAIAEYNAAPTAGIKASIARKFKTKHGVDLKNLLNEVAPAKKERVKKVIDTATLIAKNFEERKLEWQMPPVIKKQFDIQQDLIKTLWERIEIQDTKIDKLLNKKK